jgi:uncharacterized protein YecE (DUF72 family)
VFYVGCCGFPTARSKYYTMFNVVELQETFYNPPDIERLRSLRLEAPEDFIFTMKCWQAITHPLDSPTWKKSKFIPDQSLRDSYGFLRPTKEVFKAWELVVEGVKVLKAKVVVIQTPPSFNYSDINFRNTMDFFSAVDTNEFVIGWEPRGDWLEKPDKIAEVVGRFKSVIHVVDILKHEPVVVKDVNYFRLHGLNGEVNYKYKYTDDDLRRLCTLAKKFKRRETYILFNNVYMLQDAQRFKKICLHNP